MFSASRVIFYSAHFNASTISIFLFFRATISPTKSETPKVRRIETQKVRSPSISFISYSPASAVSSHWSTPTPAGTPTITPMKVSHGGTALVTAEVAEVPLGAEVQALPKAEAFEKALAHFLRRIGAQRVGGITL